VGADPAGRADCADRTRIKTDGARISRITRIIADTPTKARISRITRIGYTDEGAGVADLAARAKMGRLPQLKQQAHYDLSTPQHELRL
jgi:hypothetical protein